MIKEGEKKLKQKENKRKEGIQKIFWMIIYDQVNDFTSVY